MNKKLFERRLFCLLSMGNLMVDITPFKSFWCSWKNIYTNFYNIYRFDVQSIHTCYKIAHTNEYNPIKAPRMNSQLIIEPIQISFFPNPKHYSTKQSHFPSYLPFDLVLVVPYNFKNFDILVLNIFFL